MTDIADETPESLTGLWPDVPTAALQSATGRLLASRTWETTSVDPTACNRWTGILQDAGLVTAAPAFEALVSTRITDATRVRPDPPPALDLRDPRAARSRAARGQPRRRPSRHPHRKGTPMTLFLSAADVDDLLSTKEVIDAVEQAHADLATGLAGQPPVTTLDATDPDGGGLGSGARLISMTAISNRHQLAVVKFMADVPGNRGRGLPTQRSIIIVTSTVTGECVAVIDGKFPTRDRTAAASAVASRHLARPDSSVPGLVGAGQLAVCRYLSDLVGVPDIDGVSAATKTVETLVTLGLTTSTRSEYAPPLPKRYTGLLRQFEIATA